MDFLESLKRLLGVPPIGQQQTPQQQPSPNPNHNFQPGRTIPQQQAPYSTSHIEVGTADKPLKPLRPMIRPNSIQQLLPNFPQPHYNIYTDPNTGNRTLEDDNALPNDPNAFVPYSQPQPLPDQPYFRVKGVVNANRIRRFPTSPDYRSTRI